MQKNHQNILCVGTILLSVQLRLKLDFYCSFITKLLVHTARMIRGMDMAYYLFYCPHDQGVLSAPLTGRMDTCLGIATKCWLSGDILPAQGWHKKNVPENCCEKSSQLLLRVIPSGNSLSVVFSQWWKVLCSWYHVLLTWKEKQGPAADKWSNFCTAFVQRTLSCLLKGLKLRVLPQFYSCLIHCILLEKVV